MKEHKAISERRELCKQLAMWVNLSSRDLMVENSIKAKTNHAGLVTEIS